jgi:hypothetical protein
MLDMIVVEGIPGAVLMVRTPDFQFVGASGYAEYGTGYGNGGHFVGYESGVMYFPDTDTTIVYFVNGTGPRLSRVMDDFLDLILEKALSEREKTSQVFVAIPEVSCTMSKFHSGFIT